MVVTFNGVSRLRLARALMVALAVAGAVSLAVAAEARAEFGVVPGSYVASTSTLQAGGHGDIHVAFEFNTHPDPILGDAPDGDAKTVNVNLPPGLIANPQATPKCSSEFLLVHSYCPADTQVGVITYGLATLNLLPPEINSPVYNMVPQAGRVAELAFENLIISYVQVHLLASVRTGSDYGVTTSIPELPGLLKPVMSKVTIWGVPADPSHDGERGSPIDPAGGCLSIFGPPASGNLCPSHLPPVPFTSNPTQCESPTSISFTADSYEDPGNFLPTLFSPPQRMTGCESVPFNPAVSVQPEEAKAGAPTSYTVDVHVPQTNLPEVPSTADLRKAVVTLPQGVTVNPSAANGLQGCSDEQIAMGSEAESTCPEASKIGSVEVKTPVLPAPMQGAVYQGTQTPQHLLRLFVVAKGSGVLVKLAGSVDLNPVTGQITTTFDNNPQLPFEDFILKFKGGPRAPLVNPRTCGTATSTAAFTSWAGQTVQTSSGFEVSGDGNGAPCPGSQFAPSFVAGTQEPLAGAFSPFDLRLQRGDQDGEFQALSTVNLPPGLQANVKSVTERCTEAQANAIACPAASHIGEVEVGSGAGSSPVYVAGDVYLMNGPTSGPFKGDPFGLAVIVHAKAGPLDLGYVVVKAGIQVHDDGSVTTQSEPFPRILDGIPLQVKDVQLRLDRTGFTFNPTSCNPMSVTGVATSIEGQSDPLSSPFRVGECAALAFKPRFTATTRADDETRRHAASLDVKVSTSQGPGVGGGGRAREANIRGVEVELPSLLPSRLPVLQKACTEKQFAGDPAGCPEGSFVGTAVAHTPILASPLTGPAILVGHGGAAFPDLVIVLQGEGIRIDLTGHTQITKNRTFSKFETVPDAPISSFELRLPEGKNAVLAAIANPCGHTVRSHGRARHVAANLNMPTTITGQNGAVLKQTTKIAVTGCPRAKSAKARRARKAAERASNGAHR